jgi:hypothetical protein
MSPAPLIRTRVVKDGHSVAVRLPATLGLKPGDEVEVAIRPLGEWPAGYFDLEPTPEFPLPGHCKGRNRDPHK